MDELGEYKRRHLLLAAECGILDVVRGLLAEGTYDLRAAFLAAVRHGKVDMVAWFVPNFSVH